MRRRVLSGRAVTRRTLTVGAGLLLLVVLSIYGVSGLLRIRAMHREIAAAEHEIGALRLQAEKLTATVDLLRNDPAYIEKLAREEHGLVREGETVLKFPPRAK
jgi:cell division protein FtsB